MSHTSKILLILKEYDRETVLHSKLMALLYIIDEKIDETKHYSNSIGSVTVSIKSDKIVDDISRLENKGHIEIIEKPTYGGDLRKVYRINNSGIEAIEKQNVNEDVAEITNSVYEEYGEYPISNLLKYIREEYIDN